MKYAILATIALLTITPSHAIIRPDISSSKDCVVITAGDQQLTISLESAQIDLKTPYRDYSFGPSIMHGDGWAKPTRPAHEPKIERTRGGVHAEILYPVEGGRAFTIEADAYNDIPAVFVTSQLEETKGTGADYYFWGWPQTFQHYYTSSPAGPERVEVDTSKWIRLGYKDWFFLPSENGGLALFSKGDVGRDKGENGNPFLWSIIRGGHLGLGESLEAGFGVAGVKDENEAYRLWESIAKRNIPALRRVPDLRKLAKLDYGKPAPDWLRNADIYNGFYHARPQWNRKNISGLLSRVPLIIGVPHDKTIIDLCHRAGFRVIAYVNYMELLDTKIEAEVKGKIYYEWTQAVDHDELDLVNHHDWIAIDTKGNQIKSIWGSDNGHPGLFYTCFHQPALQEAALGQVRSLMEMGADGVFIDNAGPVKDCFGDKLGKHKHADPSKTNTQMYEQLEKDIYELVKSFGDDRIVMHNSGIIASHWPYCDAQMWESCIYGAGTKERLDEWEELRYRGEQIAAAARHGKVPVILSYLDSQPDDHRTECALYSYAYARLYGMLWADWFSLDHYDQSRDTARAIYDLRLGKPLGDAKHQGKVFYRQFERGVVVLNPSQTSESITLAFPPSATITDIDHGTLQSSATGRLRLEVSPESGRLLHWEPTP